jgi:hypothetical protein
MSTIDTQLKQDIEDQMRSDTLMSSTRVANLTAERGAVSLIQASDSNEGEWGANELSHKSSWAGEVEQSPVIGGVADVRRDDSDLGSTGHGTLAWRFLVHAPSTIAGLQSSVRFEGQVTWERHRDAAERAIRCLAGIVAAYSALTLRAEASAARVKRKFAAVLQRRGAKELGVAAK